MVRQNTTSFESDAIADSRSGFWFTGTTGTVGFISTATTRARALADFPSPSSDWTIVLPAELSAAAVLIGYWAPDINPAAWIAICLVVAVAINCGGTRVYGEMEFWFAIIKVLTIVGLIILGIILDTWKRPTADSPEPSRIGFRYW